MVECDCCSLSVSECLLGRCLLIVSCLLRISVWIWLVSVVVVVLVIWCVLSCLMSCDFIFLVCCKVV